MLRFLSAGDLVSLSALQSGREYAYDESSRLMHPPYWNVPRRCEDKKAEGRSHPVHWVLISTSSLSLMALGSGHAIASF